MENYFVRSRFCACEKTKGFVAIYQRFRCFVAIYQRFCCFVAIYQRFALFNVNKVHGTWPGRPVLA
jgi:hypothetical protein